MRDYLRVRRQNFAPSPRILNRRSETRGVAHLGALMQRVGNATAPPSSSLPSRWYPCPPALIESVRRAANPLQHRGGEVWTSSLLWGSDEVARQGEPTGRVTIPAVLREPDTRTSRADHTSLASSYPAMQLLSHGSSRRSGIFRGRFPRRRSRAGRNRHFVLCLRESCRLAIAIPPRPIANTPTTRPTTSSRCACAGCSHLAATTNVVAGERRARDRARPDRVRCPTAVLRTMSPCAAMPPILSHVRNHRSCPWSDPAAAPIAGPVRLVFDAR